MSYRPTWAEINLDALRCNLARIRGLLDRDVEILGVVKANAYGHGLCRVSHALVEEGVNYLGVATVDEALNLRRSGVQVSVLVLGSVLEEGARAAVAHDITLTLCDPGMLKALTDIAKRTKLRPRVHIKIDTGMGRIGVWHREAIGFIKEVYETKEIEVEGVYTHFCSAARDKMVTRLQIGSFEKVLKDMAAFGITVRYKHAANSVAVVDWKRSHLNLVRTGILLYGVYPKETFYGNFKLEPVMNLKTRIVYLKETPPGRSISYGRTYITQKQTKIATLPIGYADGYGRILSNRAEALVRGQRVRVVGMVTMDQTLLDVGHIKDVKPGDEVVLIGRQGEAEIPVEKVAKLSGTIPYEILAAITDRVPRTYKE
ncbi:MAG: alanine racemase [Candidatus Makaraimicrobium thalassicum]|nr:MAG: alanine racemase [Candidatus Omnitrophota bacterium]